MPYPNEHAARVRDPGNFDPESFRSKDIKGGIRIILGKLRGGQSMIVQAYRFSVDQFTPEEAKIWLDDHKINYIKFEPASEEKTVSHTGVLGMKWGVRKGIDRATGAVRSHIKNATTPSSDHLQAKALLKKKIRNLNDNELKIVADRMRLVSSYRHSGEFKTKQIRAMSNAELRTGVARNHLRKAIVKNYKSMRFKDFIKSFKMSKEDAEKLSKRMYAEREISDMKLTDVRNTKKLVDSYMEGNMSWIQFPTKLNLN